VKSAPTAVIAPRLMVAPQDPSERERDPAVGLERPAPAREDDTDLRLERPSVVADVDQAFQRIAPSGAETVRLAPTSRGRLNL
jgi:hypothetical protein